HGGGGGRRGDQLAAPNHELTTSLHATPPPRGWSAPTAARRGGAHGGSPGGRSSGNLKQISGAPKPPWLGVDERQPVLLAKRSVNRSRGWEIPAGEVGLWRGRRTSGDRPRLCGRLARFAIRPFFERRRKGHGSRVPGRYGDGRARRRGRRWWRPRGRIHEDA